MPEVVELRREVDISRDQYDCGGGRVGVGKAAETLTKFVICGIFGHCTDMYKSDLEETERGRGRRGGREGRRGGRGREGKGGEGREGGREERRKKIKGGRKERRGEERRGGGRERENRWSLYTLKTGTYMYMYRRVHDEKAQEYFRELFKMYRTCTR